MSKKKYFTSEIGKESVNPRHFLENSLVYTTQKYISGYNLKKYNPTHWLTFGKYVK